MSSFSFLNRHLGFSVYWFQFYVPPVEDLKLSSYVAPDYLPQLRKNINHGQSQHCMFSMGAIPLLAAAHIRILAGTDAGNPGTAPGISLHGELEYLVKAGLTPEQALAAATSVTASTFHLIDRGRIALGLRAAQGFEPEVTKSAPNALKKPSTSCGKSAVNSLGQS